MGDTQNLINSSLNLDQFPLEESMTEDPSPFIPDQDREETDEMSTGEILLRRYSNDDSSDEPDRESDEDDEHGVYSEIDTDDLLDRIQSRQRQEQAAGTSGTSNTDEIVERILTRNETVNTLTNNPNIEELLDYPSNENNV